MDITQWYERVAGSQSINSVAGLAGINQSTLNRQLRSGRLEPELVVAIARTFDEDILEALIIQGFLTREDVEKHAPRTALEQATDKEIVAEIERRLLEAREHSEFDKPLGEASASNVTEMRLQANPVDYDEDAGDMTADDDMISFNRPSSRGQGRYETGDPDVGDLQSAANEDARDPRAEVADREQRRRDLNL